MRETCLLCVSKHVSQAIILVIEATLGYPLHLWFAVGHLAEAETESALEFPQLSTLIRSVRVKLMGQEDGFDKLSLVELLKATRAISVGYNGYDEEERTQLILTTGILPENALVEMKGVTT